MIIPRQTVEVVEYIRRSEQGATRPFICKCDDGHIYYLKGRSAGKTTLLREWLAGCLAKGFGLPIADFAQVDVPPELIEALNLPELNDLGSGVAFGSRAISPAQEFTISHIHSVPLELQQDIFTFDWWVHNDDRNLTDKGGNPNLLWNPITEQLVVIDHNLAFAEDFDPNKFIKLHVFSNTYRDWLNEQNYKNRFDASLAIWDDACSLVPEDWRYLDEDHTNPVSFDFKNVLDLLKRYKQSDFWRVQA